MLRFLFAPSRGPRIFVWIMAFALVQHAMILLFFQ